MQPLRFEPDTADGFHATVKARVARYFRDTGKSRYADRSILAKGLVFGGLACGAYALILLHPGPMWTLLPLALLFGACSLLLAINIGHDAAHRVLFRSRAWNEWAQALAFLSLGVNAYLWRMRHTNSHHVFPNVNGCDIDIDENPYLRLSPNQPWRPRFRYQHLYAPFAYVFVALYTVVWQDLLYLFKRRLANMSDISHPRSEYGLFVLWKALYFGLVLAVPMYALPLPWWQVLGGYLAMEAVASTAFVLLLIGTHFSEATAFPEPDAEGRLGSTWAIHNLETSCDWAPHDWLAHFLVGGANAHASHHLFPGVSHAHYRAIARIIEDTAAEFGVRYNKLSLLEIVLSHFRFLRRMGRNPAGGDAPVPGNIPFETASLPA